MPRIRSAVLVASLIPGEAALLPRKLLIKPHFHSNSCLYLSSTAERQRLSGILARFRREGAAAEPVAFGSHRKPEAILLPYKAYERYEELSRQRARLDAALASAQSVQAELPGPFSPDHDREVAAYVDGEISAAELYRRTVARYRQP